ncbi:SUMO-activating enzyme subunit 1-like protein [Umbelopsis sp. PMI_123]|nr:SUMO-activating enzyme subunit 1-like protein [Umbelopsis sp. PMI_123]
MRMTTKENKNKTITEDEAALYDRQIRLWGVEAQQRIRNANILVAGIKGLGNEICKNLVLAGVGSLTILDHETVIIEDLGSQFFLTESDIGMNRAEAAAVHVQALNPRVAVRTDKDNIEQMPDAYFEQFDIVCITNASLPTLIRLDTLCRTKKTPFYAADTFGMFGYIFCDLHSHKYIQVRKEEPTTKNATPREISEPRVEEYCTLVQSLDRDWSDITKAQLKKRVSKAFPMTLLRYRFQESHGHLPTAADEQELGTLRNEYLPQLGFKDLSFLDDSMIEILAQTANTEISPVCAIVGGILAQEIIKVLSGKELPIQNWFFYDGIAGSGLIHHIEKGKSIILQ